MKNDNGTDGWGGKGPKMDSQCDRPAVIHRTAAFCFGRYQVRASRQTVEPDVVLINPHLQNRPQYIFNLSIRRDVRYGDISPTFTNLRNNSLFQNKESATENNV